MTYNPNAIFLSPSSISDFKTCQQLYFYRNIYRSPKTGLKIQITNPKLTLGGVVHDALNQFLYGFGVVKTKEELKRIFENFWNKWSGEKGGFLSIEEENQFKERANRMLERFLSNKHFTQTSPVRLPSFPKYDLGDDLILTGKLDWIEKDTDTLHIIDFKTGEGEERSDSVQLPVYALLVSGIFKNDNVKASYWYLDRDDKLTKVELPAITDILNEIKRIGMIIKDARLTNSFHCNSGFESCWACKNFVAVAKGKGKLVHVDYANRKQEVYIIPGISGKKEKFKDMTEGDDIPF